MRFVFHRDASEEYEKAAKYYSKISRQLAVSFIECIEEGITKILEYPEEPGYWTDRLKDKIQ